MADNNKKTEKKDSNYKQLYAPDATKLSMLLDMAKGPDRTMAEFVEACKGKGNVPSVSTPTFSRIKRGVLTRPVSDELLKIIAEHSDNPKVANYDSLMRANGKVPKEEYNQNLTMYEMGFGKSHSSYAAIKELVEGIITYDLIQKGQTVGKLNDELVKELAPDCYEEILDDSDFIYRIMGMDPLFYNYILADAYITWMSVKDLNSTLGNVSLKDRRNVSFYSNENMNLVKSAGDNFSIKFFMSDHYPLFIRDAWKPEVMKKSKTSFVFVSPLAYDKAKEFLKSAKLNSMFSLILVDLIERKVVKEENL